MGETKTIDVSEIRFSSTVYPTEEDMKLWESLSPAEQQAIIKRDLDEAEASGIAAPETLDQVIERLRSERKSSG